MSAKSAYGYIDAKYAGSGTATAAGTGDATKVTSPAFSRVGFDSGLLVITGAAALQYSETLSFTIDIQDGDGTTQASYKAVAKTVYATGLTGGSTQAFCVPIEVNLEGADEYLTVDITPDLSAAVTDTLTWSATMILTGPVESEAVPIAHAAAEEDIS